MTTIERIKTDNLQYRKQKHSLAAFTSFVLAQIALVGKNDGNRQTTDQEAVSVLRKIAATTAQNLTTVTDPTAREQLQAESDYLKSVLPTVVSVEVVRQMLDSMFDQVAPSKGDVFKAVKQQFGSNYNVADVNQWIADRQ